MFCIHVEPVNTETSISYMYSLIAQVYDESGTAWLKLPNSDVPKLLNEECHNLILTTEVVTNLSWTCDGFNSITNVY